MWSRRILVWLPILLGTIVHLLLCVHLTTWGFVPVRVIGTQSVASGSKLIYAMRVSEVLDFDEYYKDPRFQSNQ
jgi:hypothetical protein